MTRLDILKFRKNQTFFAKIFQASYISDRTCQFLAHQTFLQNEKLLARFCKTRHCSDKSYKNHAKSVARDVLENVCYVHKID